MKAIGVTTFGGPEVLQVFDLPEPHAGAGEVRMRVHAASVNPTDTLFRAGSQAARLRGRPEPYVPGMDAAGVDFPAASTLLLNGLTARLALDALALDAGQTMAVTGAAGAFGGYVIQLAKADGLTVIADASRSDQTLVRSLGADYVLDRGDTFAERVRSIVAEGVPGLADGARLNHLALPAIADGGAMAVILGWDGPTERHITLHKISSTAFATNTALLDQLVRQVEQGILTLRVANVLPADQAADAHRRLAAGGYVGDWC